ncbi:ArnT family glycosyltransferase [Chloroflexota bacterium]
MDYHPGPRLMQAFQSPRAALIALCGFLGILLILKPAQTPPLWFDEGWVVSLARNWVELGHYGHLQAGEAVPSTILNTGFPAVVPVALSFRLFGVGLWQARLPGILFTLGAFGALYYLAGRLYGRSVAIGTLVVGLLLQFQPDLHPILVGRQVLGEMPALFYLLSGFALLLWAWHRPRNAIPLAILFWALSLRTKPQILPFFFAALSLPLALALWKRQWRTVRLLATALLGTLAAVALLAWFEQLFLNSLLVSPASGGDPYSMVGDPEVLRTYVFTLAPSARLTAFLIAVLFGMPVLLGLLYAAWGFFRDRRDMDLASAREVGRLGLWAFAVSWLLWYLLFSIGFARYVFPALFVGYIFAAALLVGVAGDSTLLGFLKQGAAAIKARRDTRPRVSILLGAVLVPVVCLLTLLVLYNAYTTYSDDSVLKVAQFFNTSTEPDALIETYDSEIFFLLDRSYHYPPDSLQHQLNRRAVLGENPVIDYDPLSADPDYLVVGSFSRNWRLYEPVLATGAFRLVRRFDQYEVYERSR